MELKDDIFSPFPSSNQKNYLTVSDQITPTPINQTEFNFKGSIELTNRIHIEKRVRYSFWNLISDVGGFSDGIFLICNIFMGAYSAMAFKTSFLNKSYFDSDKDLHEH